MADLPTVAVTGATGLVGRAVVSHLVQSGKYNVIALGRRKDALDKLQSEIQGTFAVKVADVEDAAAMDAALSGVTVAVHAAGSVDNLAEREAIFKTNVEGTRNVLSAARKNAVTQLIHISSLSVITGQADQFDVDESAPLVTCGEPYADSKVAAEQVLNDANNANGNSGGKPAITILRPGFIYGPGERAWMPRVIESIKHGRMVLVDGGKRATNIIYSGNLARAVEGAILNERSYGEAFNLTDGQGVTKKVLFDEIARGLSLPPVKKDLPRPAVKPIFQLMAGITPLLPATMRSGLARFSPGAFRLVAVNQGFNIGKAERLLDYRDRVPFKDGMAQALQGFKKTGVN